MMELNQNSNNINHVAVIKIELFIVKIKKQYRKYGKAQSIQFSRWSAFLFSLIYYKIQLRKKFQFMV